MSMLRFFSWLVGYKTARSFCVGQEREQLNERFGAGMKKEWDWEETNPNPSLQVLDESRVSRLCFVSCKPANFFFFKPCFSTLLANFCLRPEDHFAILHVIFIKTNNLPLSLKDNKRNHATGSRVQRPLHKSRDINNLSLSFQNS